MPNATPIVIVYTALGCLIAGIAVTYEIWRAENFEHPKMSPGDLICFGLFVIVLWPYLMIAIVVDARSEKR